MDKTQDSQADTVHDALSVEGIDVVSRASKIRAIVALTKSAREDTLRLDLKFEAYLLDMAVIALSEQSQK